MADVHFRVPYGVQLDQYCDLTYFMDIAPYKSPLA